jgi:OFA family oxalate/formate antiporter-like MFS transporter
VASIGGILTGVGCLMASFSSSLGTFIVGFGLLTGAGIGLGYASATPPAVKWFPPSKTGLIAGLVVSGFGLASVYIAPGAQYLLTAYGVQTTMAVLGVAFLIVVTVLAQFLRNPPAGYKPPAAAPAGGPAKAPAAAVDYSWSEMMSTPQFFLIWIMYAFGAGAGLMIIGKLSKIVDVQAGIKAGFVLVALLAIGNAAGRIVAGALSDKIGRTRTMLIVFVLQAIFMFSLNMMASLAALVAASVILGFNYGSCLSVFPSVTKDYFGLKNYGIVFTAWGVGGVTLPILSGKIFDATGSFALAYSISGSLLVVAAVLTFLLKPPKRAEA